MIICFDLMNEESYKNCKKWYEEIQSQIDYNPYNHCLVLIGTKNDLVIDHELLKNLISPIDPLWIDAQRVKNSQVSKGMMEIMVKK